MSTTNPLDAQFRDCPGCGRGLSLRHLLESPEFEAVGMSFEGASFSSEYNSYYFNHNVADCGTTLCVPVEMFRPLITEPVPHQSLAGTEACENHCVRVSDLSLCKQNCHYAPFRRFLLDRLRRASDPEPPRRRLQIR